MTEYAEFETKCPHCGRINRLHGHPDGDMPTEGDCSVCWKCLGASVYTKELGLRQMTREEAFDPQWRARYDELIQIAGRATTPSEAIERARNVL